MGMEKILSEPGFEPTTTYLRKLQWRVRESSGLSTNSLALLKYDTAN